MATLKTHFSILLENIRDHFKTALGDFYASSAHRWLIYAITFILVGLCTFISLEVYAQSDPLLDITLAFKGMYAWHSAINFAVCLAIVDSSVAVLIQPWGRFDHRDVGKVWMVLTITYLLGFAVQRILVYKAVTLYDPELLWVHGMNPSMRPGVVPTFLFLIPFWGIISYGLIRVMLNKQIQSQELLRVRIDTILEERQRQSLNKDHPETAHKASTPDENDGFIPLPPDAGAPRIHMPQVGHVTSEDHYLRIYYQSDNKLKNILIRMSLKELSHRLPTHQFIQIHRSHIVNLEQVAGLKRTGRNIRITTKHGNFELPVSRHRFPQILPKLEKYLHPN